MAVPEPGTIALLIVSSMALFGRRRLMKFPRT
jgi:hypothetical protein